MVSVDGASPETREMVVESRIRMPEGCAWTEVAKLRGTDSCKEETIEPAPCLAARGSSRGSASLSCSNGT